jgi:RNA 3'-terminal phosphate cyclase (ATP)
MGDMIVLDGSYGEGGGQILRTALTLSALTGRALRLEKIRAGRKEPGLRPQHLAAVRAVAAICEARVRGDELGSSLLTFEPGTAPKAGEYRFDIPAVAETGSAGSVTLLFQALFLPLALAGAPSRLSLGGGTHVAWSPPYHYLTQVYLPTLEQMGFAARLELLKWGWYPQGGGEVLAHIEGIEGGRLRPLDLCKRGKLLGVHGISAISNLPEHIALRQRDRALQRLRARHIKAEIEIVQGPSPGQGAVLFLVARYEGAVAGFTGYGRIRYPAEKVADAAVEEFEAYHLSKAALDPHLADQVLLPLALVPDTPDLVGGNRGLVPGPSRYTTSEVTRHLLTNCWVIQHFLEREMRIEGEQGTPGQVSIA